MLCAQTSLKDGSDSRGSSAPGWEIIWNPNRD